MDQLLVILLAFLALPTHATIFVRPIIPAYSAVSKMTVIPISTLTSAKAGILPLISQSSNKKVRLRKKGKARTKGKAHHRVIHIRKGMSLHHVAQELKRMGMIKSVWRFKLLAWWKRASMRIHFGEYAFRSGASCTEILNTLVSGKVRLHKVTFPEGYNLFEIAEVLSRRNFLDKKKFIELSTNKQWIQSLGLGKLNSLEGYLFPDTYYIPRPVQAATMIRQMVERFLSVYMHLKGLYFFKPRPVPLTRHQLVILASIVEKETSAENERPLIASVFYNRLLRGMRFESDPTILYGMLRETGVMPVNIRKRDILKKTAYNTYQIKGWPAGPIANPGEEALKAVLAPASSAYLYFVSRNNGTHVFSKNYKDHKKAVNRWQKSL